MANALGAISIPIRATILMTVSYFWLTAYHLFDLSLWQSVFTVLCGIALPLRLTGRMKPLSKGVVFLITVASAAGFGWTVWGRFSVETAVAFFALTVSLRALELKNRRDVYLFQFVLIYLGACGLLFETGLFFAVFTLGGLLVAMWTLVALNDHPVTPRGLRPLFRSVGGLFVRTIPIVVVLFLFFPRMAPLWSVPIIANQARTGLSDEVTPGSIADLAQSDARVFRVSFGGATPPRPTLYWRTLILDHFDGSTWRSTESAPFRVAIRRKPPLSQQAALPDGMADILMEPTDRYWAYTLAGATPTDPDLRVNEQGMLRFPSPVDQTQLYRLKLATERPLSQAPDTPTGHSLKAYLQIPQGNPRTLALAHDIAQRVSDPQARIDAVMQQFRQGGYRYSLRPPLLPTDPVDGLLFDTRLGFCAHYAGAMTVLLRAAGVPARMVAGYQGGEPGAGGQYWIVSQFDAHAWVEAWVEGVGWLRYDPTSVVAPERISGGLREALRDEGSFLGDNMLSAARYGDVAWVQWARLQMDLVNYHWQRTVVGYHADQQLSLISQWFGAADTRTLGIITASGFGGVILLLLALNVWQERRRAPDDPVERVYLQMQRLAKRKGVTVLASDTALSLADRLLVRLPHQQTQVRALFRQLNRALYDPSLAQQDRRELAKTLRRQFSSLEWSASTSSATTGAAHDR